MFSTDMENPAQAFCHLHNNYMWLSGSDANTLLVESIFWLAQGVVLSVENHTDAGEAIRARYGVQTRPKKDMHQQMNNETCDFCLTKNQKFDRPNLVRNRWVVTKSTGLGLKELLVCQ